MHVEDRLGTAELLARWKALQTGELAIQSDWYELNERGDIVVTPRPSVLHQAIAGHIVFQLSSQLGLLAAQEVPVMTSAGILVPDVVWMPMERWSGVSRSDPLPFLPDICVEVLSPSNTHLEISRKIQAYLAGGSREVVVVDMQGEVQYWSTKGESSTSSLGVTLPVAPSLFDKKV